ncbi:hypothetical protein [Glycomyces artemisiae]|uniref:Uncharacterized protein n=1 Tax=Glycomyces artemisiae TaxID=1076443 RepID=A0A2T0UHX2_9ACTN|nr:hypothetical protein [Glycomyces artemisiae]PRY57437.1 hypothetical protein B0I28_107286 [Glycomyces artemisiae]
MTELSQFDDDERALILNTPGVVLKGTVVSDGSKNALVFLKEVTAGAKVFKEARKHENAFVKSVAQALRERDPESSEDELPVDDVAMSEALKLAADVADLLRRKATPDDAAAYTAWLLHLATEVASAVKTRQGGLFSKKVAINEGERMFLDDLHQALTA